MNFKYAIKCCMYILTTFVMLNFVGYTLSNDFVKDIKVSSVDFEDDDVENGKESKEETKTLFFYVSFVPDFLSFDQKICKKINSANVRLPIWFALPETPPPDLDTLKA